MARGASAQALTRYDGRVRPLAWLDPWLLRRPFVGRAAARYADQRVGFGDFDARLCARMQPDLVRAKTVLDVGAGAGELGARIAAAYPGVALVSIEPSSAYAPGGAVRARGEALPIADGAIDVAVCLSAIRHVARRAAVLRELRRVVRAGGALYLAELDPDADAARRANHTQAMRSAMARRLFEWIVLPSCPTARQFEQLAGEAGWSSAGVEPDAEQPVYVMRLS
jgi:SAM-dependent methyltransferase